MYIDLELPQNERFPGKAHARGFLIKQEGFPLIGQMKDVLDLYAATALYASHAKPPSLGRLSLL